eukprot:scaffold286915_cov30-Tisochrysis_lutea.AAC.1
MSTNAEMRGPCVSAASPSVDARGRAHVSSMRRSPRCEKNQKKKSSTTPVRAPTRDMARGRTSTAGPSVPFSMLQKAPPTRTTHVPPPGSRVPSSGLAKGADSSSSSGISLGSGETEGGLSRREASSSPSKDCSPTA